MLGLPGFYKLRRAPFIAPCIFGAFVAEITQVACIKSATEIAHLGLISLASPIPLGCMNNFIEITCAEPVL
jgi:hypothetical protein